MPEPEPELKATANLSPVSPSPVHTAPSLAVPTLQDTVDTIDAMVAAALAPNGAGDDAVVDPGLVNAGNDVDDVVDDESFSDAYAQDGEGTDPQSQPTKAEDDDGADDYAKTFDSPVGSDAVEPENGEDSVHNADDASEDKAAGAASLPPDAIEQVPLPTEEAAQDQVNQEIARSSSTIKSDTESLPTKTEEPQTADPIATTSGEPGSTTGRDAAADIHQLMAELTSHNYAPGSTAEPAVVQTASAPAVASNNIASAALPSPSSLPPRPPVPQGPQPLPEQHHPGQAAGTSASNPSITHSSNSQGGSFAGDGLNSLPPHPGTGQTGLKPAGSRAPSFSGQAPGTAEDEYQRKWEQFVADERQYMTEAKWDRFPEGSRIFIGNLSSDRVSKRDVFDMFHRFGRLAQISLKSAYGFVQYHTVEEGSAAVEQLEGVEIKGRRIHLEISRLQDKSKKDRARSPDRRGRDGGRENGRDGRRGDRYNEGRNDHGRQARGNSPRRNDHHARNDSYGRGRNSYDGGRDSRRRSRSPGGYGRHEVEAYRRRSPSPYGRSRFEGDIDLPKRYGPDVPDVQIILQPDVDRNFSNWVEMQFRGKGLRTEVMFLHPRMPKDQVIQRQAAEGVHAVVELDLRAQSTGRIPLQVFDRSAGMNNVRFEQYLDLEPSVAMSLVERAKESVAKLYAQPPYGANNGSYAPSYQTQPQQRPYAGYAPPQAPNAQPPQPASNPADIAALLGQLDPNSLQRVLATLQTPAQGAPPPSAQQHGRPGPSNGQVDLQAILSSLGGQSASKQGPAGQVAPGQYGAPYGGQSQPLQQQPQQPQQPPQAHQGAPQPGADSAAQVQNIMAQLARHRY